MSKYIDKFKILVYLLMLNIYFLNIIMVGEFGVGKLFFLNIFIIVLLNKEDIVDIYRIGLLIYGKKSVI